MGDTRAGKVNKRNEDDIQMMIKHLQNTHVKTQMEWVTSSKLFYNHDAMIPSYSNLKEI